MYKRNRTNNDETIIDNIQIKKARKEPLCAIIYTISNQMDLEEKYSSSIEKVSKNCTEDVKMECENIENSSSKEEESCNKTGAADQSFKYNSICDRDRRRHMYF